jgi:hypothetical protein
MIRQAALVAGIAMAGILLTAELVKASWGSRSCRTCRPLQQGSSFVSTPTATATSSR